MKIPSIKWRVIRIGPRLFYRIGLGPLIGPMILLLTTTGRRSGQPHTVPLQYEEIEGVIYVGAARGWQADWLLNILINPEVTVQIGSRCFRGQAWTITDPVAIADFLAYRLQQHPKIIGAIMRQAGLPKNPTREDLEAYAGHRAIVAIQPHFSAME